MIMRDYLEQKRRALTAGANRFFLPEGLTADNVLAAYQFKGVSAESYALQDLSGHGYHLTKGSGTYNGHTYTPSWGYSTGFSWSAVYGGNSGWLDNAVLNAQAIRAVIVRYADLTQDNRACLVTAGGDNGRCQLMAATSVYLNDGGYHNYGGPGFVWYNEHWRSSSTYYQSAVAGANIGTSGQIYINGTGHNTTDREAWTTKGASAVWRTFGNVVASASDLVNAVFAGKKIICAAFYNVALNAEQHKQVADAMALI